MRRTRAAAPAAAAAAGRGAGAGTPSLAPAFPTRRPAAVAPPPPVASAGPSPLPSPRGDPNASFSPLARARVALDGDGGGGSGDASSAGTPRAVAAAAAPADTPPADEAWDAMSRSSEDAEEVGEAVGDAAAALAAAAAPLRPPAGVLRVRVAVAEKEEGEEAAAALPPGLTPRAAAAAAAVGPLLARLRAIQGDGPRTPPPPGTATGAGAGAGGDGSAHGGAAAWAALNGPGPVSLPPLTRRASSLSPRAAAGAAAALRSAAVAALQGGQTRVGAGSAGLPPRSPLGSAAGGAAPRPPSPFAWKHGESTEAVATGVAQPPPPRRLVLSPPAGAPGASSSLFGVASPRPPPTGPPRPAGTLTLTRYRGHTWLNQYLVLKFLGKGAYGRVYLVMDGGDGGLYAAKVVRTGRNHAAAAVAAAAASSSSHRRPGGGGMTAPSPPPPPPDPADAARRAADFRREVALMTRASRHPGVVPLREVLLDPARGRALLLMDYAEGGAVLSRSDLEGGRRLSEAVAGPHFAAIARALHFLHASRILHGDVKPENVLLTAAGGAVLSDFGCARLMKPLQEKRGGGGAGHGAAPAPPSPASPSPRHDARDAGFLADPLSAADDLVDRAVGTPAFLAPEQCRPGARYRGRPADVWALGVTLYAWVTGRLPFNAGGHGGWGGGGGGDEGGGHASAVAALFASIQGDPLRFPSSLTPPLSPSLRDLLGRMLVKDPAGRAGLEEVLAHPWVVGAGGNGEGGAGAAAGPPAASSPALSAPLPPPLPLQRADHLASHLLTPACKRVAFADGEVMLRQGGGGGEALFLLSGVAEVVIRFPPGHGVEGGGEGRRPLLSSRPTCRPWWRPPSGGRAAWRPPCGGGVVGSGVAPPPSAPPTCSPSARRASLQASCRRPPPPPPPFPPRFASVVARGPVTALVVPGPVAAASLAAVPAAAQQARQLEWARAAEVVALDAVVRLAGLCVSGGGVGEGAGSAGGGAGAAATPAAAPPPLPPVRVRV